MDPITEPGVRHDIPEADYHADPALSSSGAKLLLPPSTPARFHHDRQQPPPPTDAMRHGSAAHRQLLGVGQNIAVIPHDDWRTKAAQQAVREAQESGHIPMKPEAAERVAGMVKALREHPVASMLFDPDTGTPEASAWWRHPTGVMLRCRFDFLPNAGGPLLLVPDYKTCQDASDPAVSKAIETYRYHWQAAWYEQIAEGLGLAGEVRMCFVFQEVKPPYLVNIGYPDDNAMRIAEARVEQAIHVFRDCTATGVWPGYSTDIQAIPLPRWAEIRDMEDIDS